MLGMRIAALRRQAGISQRELARRLNVSASAVGMYEQGRREPAADRLVGLAAIFGVSTDYLLTGIPAEPGDARAAAELVSFAAAACEGQLLLRRPDGTLLPMERDELTSLICALLGN